MDLKTILRMIAEGRGQGSGQNFQPWIKTQDFPSQGQRNREFGVTTQRQHDYMSLQELHYHYIVDWTQPVKDIQEQFPLFSLNSRSPLDETLAIAKQCGIRYPTCRVSKEPVPLTTDFLLTIARPIGVVKVARTVKLRKDLLDMRKFRRIIEKFEIERRYWKARGVHWAIVTDREINLILADNIKWALKFYSTSELHPLAEQSIVQIAIALTEMVTQSNAPLCEVALNCDERLGLDSGRCLTVARHLIATRQWLVDMTTKPIHPAEKLELLRVALSGRDNTLRKASGE
jgi:hypothetical protein